ncbi:MAG: SEC-C metal-binding domain-containing protein [Alkalispirochaeta sp.]
MKLGRNEPCHCGSGKKYKHCHYEEDRRAEAQALAEAAEARKAAAQEEESAEDEESSQDGTAGNPQKRDRGGSRFMRDSTKGGAPGATGKPSGGASTNRMTRGSQRGG